MLSTGKENRSMAVINLLNIEFRGENRLPAWGGY